MQTIGRVIVFGKTSRPMAGAKSVDAKDAENSKKGRKEIRS
jgi:hypothetical protein